MPGIPVCHSKDLINWQIIGHAYDSITFQPQYRMENEKTAYSRLCWAPTIRYDEGIYYIGVNIADDGFVMFKSTRPEGPYTMKKGDTYYMMYSANYYKGKNYAVGYATAKSPLGPFVKSNDNPVLQKNVEQGGIVTGTGHNSVTWSKDGKQMYCVYHGYTQKTGNERVVFIDKMGIDENGKLYVEGPNAE